MPLSHHDSSSSSHNIWILRGHWGPTSKNKLHIKRETDTVPQEKKKGLQVSVCVQVFVTQRRVCICVCANDCVNTVRACTGVYLSARRPSAQAPTVHATTCRVDMSGGHMRVCLYQPGHVHADLLDRGTCVQFFFSFLCEKTSCYYRDSNGGYSFLARGSEATLMLKKWK